MPNSLEPAITSGDEGPDLGTLDIARFTEDWSTLLVLERS